MNVFLRHKIIIMRILGGLMLVISFTVHFWTTPKEGLSANDKAMARIERMEASTKGNSIESAHSREKDTSKFLNALKDTQAKQMKYMTIIVMLLGIGFLSYSFFPKRKK